MFVLIGYLVYAKLFGIQMNEAAYTLLAGISAREFMVEALVLILYVMLMVAVKGKRNA